MSAASPRFIGPATVLLAAACAHHELPTTTLEVAGTSISVEVADDPEERARGLMFRERLGANDGMLFVYPNAEERSFWMKDTRIPLSIAWIDPQGRVLGIDDMLPLDTTPIRSGEPALYALEMNRGWFAAHGVHTGDVLRGLPTSSER